MPVAERPAKRFSRVVIFVLLVSLTSSWVINWDISSDIESALAFAKFLASLSSLIAAISSNSFKLCASEILNKTDSK